MFKASDIMTTTVVTVDPEATMKEIASLLVRHRVSGAPVVDSTGKLVGVISEFDLLKLVYSPEIEFQRVADHMSTHLLTVEREASLIDVVDIFLTHPVRRLPVLCDGTMVGLISRHDLIRFVLMTRNRIGATQRAKFDALSRAATASDQMASAPETSPLTSNSCSTT